ncbi:MAG: hypothetical protein AAGA30_12125, partial [Planctomycetota bacterium]
SETKSWPYKLAGMLTAINIAKAFMIKVDLFTAYFLKVCCYESCNFNTVVVLILDSATKDVRKVRMGRASR